jgi:hypothetical protein
MAYRRIEKEDIKRSIITPLFQYSIAPMLIGIGMLYQGLPFLGT